MEVDHRVELEAFSGPLDLLLLLVRRHEIDLHDIPIAQLTEQYLQELNLLKEIDVDLAGEFLVMAATLLEIKSAMLLPRPESVESNMVESNEKIDPRFELVQQLMAYKRFKDVAFVLDQQREQWQARYARRPAKLGADDSSGNADNAELIEIDLEDAHVLNLCEAFSRILDTIGRHSASHDIVDDDTPIALHAEDIVDRLQRDGPMSLQAIFVGRSSRGEMIGLFLATLELIRQRKVRVVQDRIGGEINLDLCSQEQQQVLAQQDESPHDWRDPETGEVQYEWPSEEVRERAERRARTRLARLKQQSSGDDGDKTDATNVDD